MTTKQTNWIIAAIFLCVSALVGYSFVPGAVFAIGTNALENYSPAVLYNGGVYSALPIQTTSTVTAASATLTGALTAASATITGALSVATVTLNASSGSISTQAVRTTMTGATTTPCALQNPSLTATSSIANFAAQINVGTSTLSLLTLATSTTAFATTSLITTATIAANNQGLLTWEGGVNNTMLPPGGWIVLGAAGASGANGFTYSGTCSATIQTI